MRGTVSTHLFSLRLLILELLSNLLLLKLRCRRLLEDMVSEVSIWACSRQSKIQQLDVERLGDHNVGWLYISVYHVRLMNEVDGAD